MNIEKLLKQNEGSGLDFKRCFHSNKAKLVHDILCLANANIDSDRYIMFGIEDGTKLIYDTNDDENYKTNACIQDFLNAVSFNIRPDVLMIEELVENKRVCILKISNKPNKPYFLLKDYPYQGTTVRAGVIYSRTCDVNTPINTTASDYAIGNMWKERFGLNLTPLEQGLKLLSNQKKWNKKYMNGSELPTYVHEQHSEFRIICRPEEDLNEKWNEIHPELGWTYKFMDRNNAWVHQYVLMHNDIELEAHQLVVVDGGRQTLPYPYGNIKKDSFAYMITCLVNEIESYNYSEWPYSVLYNWIIESKTGIRDLVKI